MTLLAVEDTHRRQASFSVAGVMAQRDSWPKACDECGQYFYPIKNGSRRTSFCLQCAAHYWSKATAWCKGDWIKVAGESPEKWIETQGCDLVGAVWPPSLDELERIEFDRGHSASVKVARRRPRRTPKIERVVPEEALNEGFGKWTGPWLFERPIVGYDDTKYDDERDVYSAHNSVSPRARYPATEREPWRKLLAWSEKHGLRW